MSSHSQGQGLWSAEAAADKYHGVQKFDVVSGEQAKAPAGPPSYTGVFAKALVAEAERDDKVVAISAAMPSGTGLDKFGVAFPDRMFDVGIAEQHAVTFAAGLAAQGYRPFCAIYSTFPAARLRSGRARRRDLESAKCCSGSIGRASSAPMAPPMPAASISPISALCPISR